MIRTDQYFISTILITDRKDQSQKLELIQKFLTK